MPPGWHYVGTGAAGPCRSMRGLQPLGFEKPPWQTRTRQPALAIERPQVPSFRFFSRV